MFKILEYQLYIINILQLPGVTVDTMLKTFQQYEDKGHSSVRQKAMLTLLQGFTGEEMLTQENTEKVYGRGVILIGCMFSPKYIGHTFELGCKAAQLPDCMEHITKIVVPYNNYNTYINKWVHFGTLGGILK